MITTFPLLQATNEVIARVPKATQEEMLAAVDSCSRAFRSWSETSILARQQIFLRYQQLIKDNIVGRCMENKNTFMVVRWLAPLLWFEPTGYPRVIELMTGLMWVSYVSERTCQVHHSGTGEDPRRCRGRCVQRIA